MILGLPLFKQIMFEYITDFLTLNSQPTALNQHINEVSLSHLAPEAYKGAFFHLQIFHCLLPLRNSGQKLSTKIGGFLKYQTKCTKMETNVALNKSQKDICL